MPDNVRVTSPSTGTIIATDDIGGVHVQRVKPVLGPDGSAVDLAFGQAAMAASVPVVIASDQAAVPVSASSLPLPTNAATEATLANIAADVDRLPVLVSGRMPVDGSGVTQPVSGSVSVSNFPATQPVSGTVGVSGSVAVTGPLTDGQLRAAAVPVTVGNFPATQPVSGPLTDTQLRASAVPVTGPLTDTQLRASAVPVSASALPLPAGAATETTLAEIRSDTSRLPVLVSGRMPVDGSGVTQPVSAGSLPLPAGAATETTLAAMNAKMPALGQAAMVASRPVAIASDQSALPVSLPGLPVSSFTQSGVIAINTDLLVIDCSAAAAVSISCIAMGTSGVVTPAWSNDGTNYTAASIMTPAGGAVATFNAAGLWSTAVQGRFLRLRLTAATTALTTTLSVQRLSQANALPTVSQTVAVAGTVPISGSLTSAGTTTNTPVTPTTTVTNSAATTNAANLKNSAGTVWSLVAYNAGASPVYVKLYNTTTAPTVGTTVPAMVLAVPATATTQIDGGANGIRFATGISIAIVTGAADSDATAVAANQVKVTTSWT